MASKAKQVILGIDLDGVCADFYGEMRKIAAEWLERPVKSLTRNVTYGLAEWGITDYDNLHRWAVTERDFFKRVPMIKGARRVLRKLSGENYRIRIITHRLFIRYFHEIAVSQTIHWLDHHGIPYWDLCFVKEKGQVGADIYVEDSPHNIEALRAKRLYAICFANSTNRKIPAPRARNWDEVYRLVKKRAPKSDQS